MVLSVRVTREAEMATKIVYNASVPVTEGEEINVWIHRNGGVVSGEVDAGTWEMGECVPLRLNADQMEAVGRACLEAAKIMRGEDGS
jgi:hypothetical protein